MVHCKDTANIVAVMKIYIWHIPTSIHPTYIHNLSLMSFRAIPTTIPEKQNPLSGTQK